MLTALKVERIKPAQRPRKHADGAGLYLLVNPNGAKYWRLKYRHLGREKLLALGVYPDVSLREAREKAKAARDAVESGRDPSDDKRIARRMTTTGDVESFEAVALEWLGKFSAGWSPDHVERIRRRFERDLFPWLGAQRISTIEPPDLLATLRRVEARGRLETAHRARADASKVFRYAVATGRAKRDPTADLRGALPPVPSRHFAAVTDPREVGALLRAIEGYQGTHEVATALRLAPYLFSRPGELRAATWSEFDLDAAEWRIPAERMKARRPHLVPLARQSVALLRELQPLTGEAQFLFPCQRGDRDRPMSNNTLNAALRRVGYSGRVQTAHGFRSMAGTLLREQGFNDAWIEVQLAHIDPNKTRGAYDHARYLPQRREMMQAWADFLDALKTEGTVVPIRRQKGRARPTQDISA